MLNWILKFIPDDWKWNVAAKKTAYLLAKMALAGLMYGKVGQHIGSRMTPEQQAQFQLAITGAALAGLESLHDFLKLKFPKSNLL